MKVAIYGIKVNSFTIVTFKELFKLLARFNWTPVLEVNLKKLLSDKIAEVDAMATFADHHDLKNGFGLLISLGGDGTFIDSVGFIRDSQVPIIGINAGRLGFLANISKDHIEAALQKIHDKEYELQVRSLLRIKMNNTILGEDNFALNEVSLHKRDTSSMITVHAELEGKYLNSYWADGLIVATPTGSTAYSLSCNGPIVTPGCKVHILTPIAPHNLNVRPMVVPDHMPIRLTVEGRVRRYLVSIDGKSHVIQKGEELIIEKAEFTINVIKFEGNNFLDTIRNKMLWGIDKRNLNK
ncbi:MAG: NAD kinase [Bacteroidota bacterium]